MHFVTRAKIWGENSKGVLPEVVGCRGGYSDHTQINAYSTFIPNHFWPATISQAVDTSHKATALTVANSRLGEDEYLGSQIGSRKYILNWTPR